MARVIETDTSYVDHYKAFYDSKWCDDLTEKLKVTIPWKGVKLFVYNKWHYPTRRNYFCLDDGIKYPGNVSVVTSWVPEVEAIRNDLWKVLDMRFNSCIITEYKDGEAGLSFHSDKELHPDYPMVVSISMGATRDFVVKSKYAKPTQTYKIPLECGDCLVMGGRCQQEFVHSIPKRAKAGYRISLTFRVLP